MPSVGNLKVRLGLELKQFDRGMRQIKRRLGGIQTLIGGAFAATVGSKFVSLGKSAIDAGDKFTKLRDSLGESTDFLQFLDFAAQRSGSNLDTFATAIQRAKRRMSEFAKSGKGELSAVMGELSDEFRQGVLAGKDFEELLPVLARDMGNLATDGDRLRVAMKLVDSEAARPLLQLFANGAEGVSDLSKQFEKLGGAVSEDTLDSMADFNDALTDVGVAFKQLILPIFEEFMPVLKSFSDGIRNAAQELRGFFKAEKRVREALTPEQRANQLANLRKKSALGLLPGQQSQGSGGVQTLPVTVVTAPFFDPELVRKDVETVVESAKEKFSQLGEAIQNVIQPSVDLIRSTFTSDMPTALEEFVAMSHDILGTWAQQMQGFFFDIFNGFTTGIGDAVANAIVFGEDLGESLKRLMKNIAAFTIATLIKMALQKLILDKLAMISSTAVAKKQVSAHAGVAYAGTFAWWSSVLAPAAKGFASAAGALALAGGMAFLADGGIVNRATAAVIGEAGPEAVIPLDRVGEFMGGGEPLTVIWKVDGRELASLVTEHQPGLLTVEGIGA